MRCRHLPALIQAEQRPHQHRQAKPSVAFVYPRASTRSFQPATSSYSLSELQGHSWLHQSWRSQFAQLSDDSTGASQTVAISRISMGTVAHTDALPSFRPFWTI